MASGLIKFVLTDGQKTWFTMYDTAVEAITAWAKSPFDYAVERWSYTECADGSHDRPYKSTIQERLSSPPLPKEREEDHAAAN